MKLTEYLRSCIKFSLLLVSWFLFIWPIMSWS